MTTGAISLVTDSTAGIHALDPSARWHVVPLEIEIDGRRYREGPGFSAAEFHRLLQEANAPPETLPPTVDAFVESYEPLVVDGGRVVSIHLSGGLSQTVERAREAARRPGLAERVRVVDSGLAGPALGLVCLETEARIERGDPVDAALDATREIATAATVHFSVYTLDFLYLGGRLERVPRPAGGHAEAEDRPILTVEDGRLTLVERVVGETTRVERMAQMVEERFGRDEPLAGAIVHAGSHGQEAARRLEKRLRGTSAGRESAWLRAPLGPVACAHTGFDVCGVAAYPRSLSALGPRERP